MCDGFYDCKDKTDEIIEENCHHKYRNHIMQDPLYCLSELSTGEQHHYCSDSSYCLPGDMMCDGIPDCRDGSDEGPFCANWTTMCTAEKNPCVENITRCFPDRNGPTCMCESFANEKKFNYEKKICEDVDECAQLKPHCSHYCENAEGRYICSCDEGYTTDPFSYLCYATGPEGLIFFTTADKIALVKIKSKHKLIIAQDIKQAHGVSYDGTYVYWVQTEQGHQAIMRAQLDDFAKTKQVLVSIGLEDPGDIAIDWLGGHLYFSDVERGAISVCRTDGSMCTNLHTNAKQPRFVTLDVKNGTMYWADWHHRPLIMMARMDGSQPEVLIDSLHTFATGLALDVPNGRLYYVDKTIKVFKLDSRQGYSLFEEPFHHPYAIAVFENTIFWSDWTSNSIQTIDKLHGPTSKRSMLITLDTPIYDMHIYHPVLYANIHNPCANATCSHLCLRVTNTTVTCACPTGMVLHGNNCELKEDYHPLYLVVGGGSFFTRLDYNSLGNPEVHTTHFDIGRVQAMAYDNTRDTLYIYDGQRKTINYINMSDFTLGITHLFLLKGLEDIVDMDYDYVTDSLYLVDAGRHFIEVVSLRTQQRALLFRFAEDETPVSICVMPDYGKMLVAIMVNEENKIFRIDSIGLDGQDREHLIRTDIRGPRIRLGYDSEMDVVYMADDGNGLIDLMHPEGTGRETFRHVSTTVTSMEVTDSYLFWTDRKARLYWSNVHEASHNIRRFEFTMFPENTQLHIQATYSPPDPLNPLLNHTCRTSHPCSHICVQTPHAPFSTHRSRKTSTPESLGYRCFCPPGLLLVEGTCTLLATCKAKELYCHISNECVPNGKYCDGVKDCKDGEDEYDCKESSNKTPKVGTLCVSGQIPCNGVCIHQNETCTEKNNSTSSNNTGPICASTEYQVLCSTSRVCLERAQMCDGHLDCPTENDEKPKVCDSLVCQDHEYRCATGSCIYKNFVCDGEPDCSDWSDEVNCTKSCGLGFYRCRSKECIELKKRCDGKQDCLDRSDEEDCEEPSSEFEVGNLPVCTEHEHTCELNRSICIPLTARCNNKVECPGGTDEINCDFHCAPHGKFECRQELLCVEKRRLCNGHKDCLDGSDETPEACKMVNRPTRLYPKTRYPAGECYDGYVCDNGQCIEVQNVCDNHEDCDDGSDEHGNCSTTCDNHTCAFLCVNTPREKPHCMCPDGLWTDGANCYDLDECKQEVCSHVCHNVAGTFVCKCHHGYTLRSDRRTCKAIEGELSALFASRDTVWEVTSDGHGSMLHRGAEDVVITDMDIDFKRKRLYMAIPEVGELVEVTHNGSEVVVTNVGIPTKVSVDWLTGNIYFADNSPAGAIVRVCNVNKRHCSKLQKMPAYTKITSLVVDPPSGQMFYCIARGNDFSLWSATLAGFKETDLAVVKNCTGLAVDSFKQIIYIAETKPSRIIKMNFNGEKQVTIINDQKYLRTPHSLTLFEDSVYFLASDTLKITRCSLFGKKLCEPFTYKGVPANAFVLKHPSIQRDDVPNPCQGVVCTNLCVGGPNGTARCMCGDQTPPVDNVCRRKEKSQLPRFNGWTHEDYQTVNHAIATVITGVLVLVTMYLIIFLYYNLVHKKRRAQTSPYMRVRFQNAPSGSTSPPSTAVVEVNPTLPTQPNEFVNPFEYVLDLWDRAARRQRRPIGTAGLEINIPYDSQVSDTESDLDERESHQIVGE
ncbi:vitellogenin receptor Yl [Ostrinia nubilalis]|uniref:vitellogenin receptor Yl n=1 Tax=Ostrinia nubilalis TaxID=29057 RepID=UPI0030824A2C